MAPADAAVRPSKRQLRPEEAAALLASYQQPQKALNIDDEDTSDANDSNSLCHLLGAHETACARVLLRLPAESATILSTGVCRELRRTTAPLYQRYCRIAVRRLEANTKAGATALSAADEAERQKATSEAAREAAQRAAEAEQALAKEVAALLCEASCNSFCLGDSGSDADAPWRLRSAVQTLRLSESTGQFQVCGPLRIDTSTHATPYVSLRRDPAHPVALSLTHWHTPGPSPLAHLVARGPLPCTAASRCRRNCSKPLARSPVCASGADDCSGAKPAAGVEGGV